MLDHARSRTLAWAIALALAFTALAVAVTRDRRPLDGIDDWGRQAEDWADGHPGLIWFLRLVEDGLDTTGMTVLTVLLAVALFASKHRRAALYAVLVMVATSLATTGLKLLFERTRPDWQDPVELLTTKSFPSGHASSVTAYAVVLGVLAAMFLRRANLRRLAYAGCALLVVVAAVDR
ncbi:MAG TPA: phosphatase PAP2 family protein, partial [Nocardioides sp.]